MFNPLQDGKNHINVYSGGQTWLGRMLSNFAHTPFTCEDGTFESVEGYWHWLNAEGKEGRDVLRNLYGKTALTTGRQIRAGGKMRDFSVFQNKIRRALELKLQQHPQIQKALANSTLPFTHYYVMGGTVRQGSEQWVLEVLEALRKKRE